MSTSIAVDLRRHTCTVFGCEVVLACVGAPSTPFAQVEEHLRHLERRFSRFLDGNELAALNGAAGRWVEVGPELERLLAHALRVAVESRGLVNIAVTPAVRRAGYVAPWPSAWRPAEPPAAVPVLTEVLELRPGRARLAPGSAVDFGALAKGLWADDAAARLGDEAAASLGGDVAARGGGPAGEGWPVGLPGGRTLLLRDGGVATSGTWKRAQAGRHHVIDPRTGLPARSGLREVTVVAGSAATAEWLATAVLVAGPGSAPAQHPDVVACFPVADEPGGQRDG